ncbi:MAG: VanW family protein [Acidimicrobiia bacterium]|nr:VanW family protein [Acidimicrobiia bacterium]
MKSVSRRTLAIAALALLGAFLLVLGAFGLDRFVHSDEVLRNVNVAGVEVSGLDTDTALDALGDYGDTLITNASEFTVAGTTVVLDPASVGFDIDKTSALATARDVGRQGSILRQFGWWIGHLFSSETVPVEAMMDRDALDQVLAEWERDVIGDLPFPGDVVLVEGTPVASYPTPGTAIDRDAAAGIILASVLSPTGTPEALPTRTVAPPLTEVHVDAAVASATRMLSGPVTLSLDDPKVEVVFTASDLEQAFETEVVLEPQPLLLVGFSSEAVAEKLTPLREQLEVPPVDATFEFGEEDDSITINPGRNGTIVDPELAKLALEQAALTVSRTGMMPFEAGAEPEVTTEDLESLGITGLVSKASTSHPCCQARVENIHLFADIVNETIVLPGESLSLNELVGQRTLDRGFKPAPTIIGGKIIDTVGGGVSQFATTFYNAVFWGGYDDVTHTPHSYYFSRYPEGIEATISWPLPNLEFRNDTEAAVLIKTEYDDTTITVEFYGDTGGRVVEGDVSGRFNFTEPSTDYIANDELEPGTESVNVEGRGGWSVTVTRTITEGDGTVREESWLVRYKPQPREIQVHSCMIPPGEEGHTGEDCPLPETTTTIAASTTTTVPVTTTTVP